jgi:hypothetical protein
MKRQTKKNGAPAWELTEIAITMGTSLARKHNVDPVVVLTALYLAHAVFSQKIRGSIQKNHTALSAKFAASYLKKWKVPVEKQKIILNAILAHHDQIATEYKEAEVMKNAEGFKFLTWKGVLVFLHHLGSRGIPFDKAIKQVKYKMGQKLGYLTLSDAKRHAKKNYKAIIKVLNDL